MDEEKDLWLLRRTVYSASVELLCRVLTVPSPALESQNRQLPIVVVSGIGFKACGPRKHRDALARLLTAMSLSDFFLSVGRPQVRPITDELRGDSSRNGICG